MGLVFGSLGFNWPQDLHNLHGRGPYLVYLKDRFKKLNLSKIYSLENIESYAMDFKMDKFKIIKSKIW